MFEQEYKRANDRIHPRKDLLKEMEAQWAVQQAQPEEKEQAKVVAFPTWARFASAAAGILLCVGLGMGSVLLYSRSRGMENRRTAADAKVQMAAEAAMVEEEPRIITETTSNDADFDMAAEAEDAAPADMEPGLMMAAAPAAVAEIPQGMHKALDEAEVEDAVRGGSVDMGEAAVQMTDGAAAPELDADMETKGMAAEENAYAQGTILRRDDLLAVFLPTMEQIKVMQYANKRLTNVFSVTLRERDARIRQVYWVADQFLILRERGGDTELVRLDVADWKKPQHLRDLTQSGAFLDAGEMDGKLFVLSRCEVDEQEPLPWIDGARMDFDQVLLDRERPGDVYTIITVYDPAGEGFLTQTAVLADAQGALIEANRLLLWAGAEETDLYVLAWDGAELSLEVERTLPGTVLDGGLVGESFSLLLETGDDVALLTLDRALSEEAAVSAQGVVSVRFAQTYENCAVVLTENAFHYITEAGDSTLDVTGDGFTWLAPDRGLILSTDGRLQVVGVVGHEVEALGSATVRTGLAALLEDPSRLAYDLDTGRLVFPGGQNVYLYQISEAGELTLRSTPINFYDHDEAAQWELRVLITDDHILLFYKDGVALCNQYLVRQSNVRY